jgi:hypothetical protein
MGAHNQKHPIQQSSGIDGIMNFSSWAFRNTKIQPARWEEASDRSSPVARGIRGPPPLFARLAAPRHRSTTNQIGRHGEDRPAQPVGVVDQHQDHTCLGPPGRDLGPRPRSDRGVLGHHRAGGSPVAHHPLLVAIQVEALRPQPRSAAPPKALR